MVDASVPNFLKKKKRKKNANRSVVVQVTNVLVYLVNLLRQCQLKVFYIKILKHLISFQKLHAPTDMQQQALNTFEICVKCAHVVLDLVNHQNLRPNLTQNASSSFSILSYMKEDITE